MAVARPGRLDSKSKGGVSSLYMGPASKHEGVTADQMSCTGVRIRASAPIPHLRVVFRFVLIGDGDLFRRYEDDLSINLHRRRRDPRTRVRPQGLVDGLSHRP